MFIPSSMPSIYPVIPQMSTAKISRTKHIHSGQLNVIDIEAIIVAINLIQDLIAILQYS